MTNEVTVVTITRYEPAVGDQWVVLERCAVQHFIKHLRPQTPCTFNLEEIRPENSEKYHQNAQRPSIGLRKAENIDVGGDGTADAVMVIVQINPIIQK